METTVFVVTRSIIAASMPCAVVVAAVQGGRVAVSAATFFRRADFFAKYMRRRMAPHYCILKPADSPRVTKSLSDE